MRYKERKELSLAVVTTLDRHTKSKPSDLAWKDISEDVIEDIIELWGAARDWLDDN